MTTTESIAVALPPPIPGLRFRRFAGPDDYEAVAAAARAANGHDGVPWMPDAANVRTELEHTADFEPRRDLILAEVDGEAVAFGQVIHQVRDGLAVYTSFGAVRPEWRRRGLGRAILAHNEAHARALAEMFDDAGGRVLGAWADEQEGGARALLEAAGYEPVRYYFLMRRPHLEDIPDAPLPAGLEIRPVQPEHHRAIFEADSEAFRDHWGHREPTEADFERMFASPDLDTGLWVVAWDGDEVVGSVQTMIWRSENEALGVRRGWLEHISVRRPWRRRGVARAIIAEALRRLRGAGMEEAMLGVDAENPTGALQLYEVLGFEVHDRGATYRKAWEPGGRLT